MKVLIMSVAFLFLHFLLLSNAAAEEKQKLYIGIEKNRVPYSDLDDKQQPQGILITAVTNLCDDIGVECEFVTDQFDTLLTDLKTYQINALVNIDTFLSPKTDKLKILSPFCKQQSVFIKKIDTNNKITQASLEGLTIGVREDSLMHMYLLNEYGKKVRLKTYPLIESGYFDLVMGRIDILSVDLAFFRKRIQKTYLGKSYAITQLLAQKKNKSPLSSVSMTLVLRENDTDLYDIMSKALKANGSPPYCANLLLGRPNQSQTSIPVAPINFDVPMPETSVFEDANPSEGKMAPKD